MSGASSPQRTYRCHYHPLDGDGRPVPCESGVLPFVDVQAAHAEAARVAAYTKTRGCPVAEVARLEPAWPGAPLTAQQQRERRAMQAALKAGTLARWPAGLATFAGVAAATALITACGGGDPEPDAVIADVCAIVGSGNTTHTEHAPRPVARACDGEVVR